MTSRFFFLWKVIGDQTARIIVYSIIWIASYCKIYRHVDLNWIFFWLKFVLRFFSNKFRLVFYTKLLGYLIEPNEKTCSWLFFPYKIWTTNLTLYFHICKYLFYTMKKVLNDNIITFYFCYYYYYNSKKYLFYTMNKVLNDNIITFYFCYYCYKSKKLECKKEI